MQGNNHTAIYIKLHLVKDNDIIKRLSDVGNKQGYIKSLIRKDLQEGGKHK